MGKEKFTYIQRRIGTCVGGYNQQFRRLLAYVIFRCGNFGYIKCSVCVFGGYSESIAWNMDIYFQDCLF